MAGGEEIDLTFQAFRDHVRESFFFKVAFQLLSQGEYEKKRADNLPKSPCVDSNLMSFLMEIDKKLDQVISYLTGKGMQEEALEEGVGLDLSGGGMRMRVGKPLAKGQILCANLLLSRVPLERIRVFGEVVNVNLCKGKEATFYDVRVRFIDLDSEERDRIIACVFQRQREVLRKRRGKDGTAEEVTKSVE
jgi:hypothetical protein